MVTLKKIKKEKGYIEAEYYPENSSKKGYMKIRIADKCVVDHENASIVSAPHVKRTLIRLSSLERIPEQKTVLWY